MIWKSVQRFSEQIMLNKNQRDVDSTRQQILRHCERSEAIHGPQTVALDRFVAEPVIGPRFARTRWLLAMTDDQIVFEPYLITLWISSPAGASSDAERGRPDRRGH